MPYGWLWPVLVGVAAAQEDPSDLDDDGIQVDDGEVPEAPDADLDSTCNLEEDDASLASWASVANVRVSLAALPAGESWALEIEANGRTSVTEWVEIPTVIEGQPTLHTITIPSQVLTAARTRPIVLSVRAILERANGTSAPEVLDNLVLNRSGSTNSLIAAPAFVHEDHTVGGELTRLANYKEEPGVPTSGSVWLGGGPTLICAEYQPDWADADLDTTVTGSYTYDLDPTVLTPMDDFLATTANVKARGALIKVVHVPSGFVQAKYAEWNGPDAGCAEFLLAPHDPHDIFVWGSVIIDQVVTQTYPDPTSPIWSELVSTFTPGAAPPTRLTVFTSKGHEAWDVQAVTSWGLFRRRAGLAGTTIVAYSDGIANCSAGAAACSKNGKIYFKAAKKKDSAHKRWYIGHELGHAVGYWLDGGKSPDKNYDAPHDDVDRCGQGPQDGHRMNSKEYSSAAAVEGFAHYYAALTFNKTDDDDCVFVYNKSVDWDGDGVNDSLATEPVNCQGDPMFDAQFLGIDDRNYFDDVCVSPPAEDRGTEYDWLRFLWDLDTDQGLTFGDIGTIWDAANPKGWDPNGGGLFDSDDPWPRFEDAADPDFATEVANVAGDNGVAQ